ncbi:hypothetical protein JW960_17825 [candidate division KSB1 bacterium]|nr:hypothetical protein [candidate division KSB1 bacterium]
MEKTEHFHKTRRVGAIIGMTIGGVILAMIMALLFGLIVMWLWNWLMPTIFGLTAITFWQAWGLVVLSHILFKSFPHHKSHYHDERWKTKFRERYCKPQDHEEDSEDKIVE